MKNNSLSWFLAGSFFGTFTALLFDPVRGNYRRAFVRDKIFRFQRQARKSAQKYARDYSNRVTGFKVEMQKILKGMEVVSDEVLVARVRSEMGRVISHPKAVYVMAKNGVITLSGLILTKEVNKLIRNTETVAGVKKVVNQLEAYATAGNIPSLQGHATGEFLLT